MTLPGDAEVRAILRARGAPRFVVEGGAQGLIAAWRRFVGQVEDGYPLGLDEYRNDLDVRTLIEITGLAGAVEAEDRRFRAALSHTDREVWSSDVPDAFWVRGYPANASGELEQDLRALVGI